MAELHFVSGKGGVGKSCVSAAIARSLARRDQAPVLFLDFQGQGQAFKALGHPSKVGFESKRCFDEKHIWLSRVDPFNSFKEYISVLLSLGSDDDGLLGLTSRLRESMTEFIAENKIVRAFVRACPGLEPIVLLGKACWEANKGQAPEEEKPWKHIVIDAPSSGHFTQLFKSTRALVKVFPKGPILSQAERILRMVRDPSRSHYYIVTLAEELPAREALDLKETLRELELPEPKVIVNRAPFDEEFGNSEDIAEDWKQQFVLEKEKYQEKKKIVSRLADNCNSFMIYPQSMQVSSAFTDRMCEQFQEQGILG